MADSAAAPVAPPAAPLPGPLTGFARGLKLYADARYAEALPLVSASTLATTPLADYAAFYAGLTRLRLGDAAAARPTLSALRARRPAGFLAEAALLAEADAAVAQSDHVTAVRLYGEAADKKPAALDDVLMRLARSAQAMGDRQRAADTYARIYAEFPLGDPAAAADAELEKLAEWPPLASGTSRWQIELARAERLFAARRFPQARTAFETLRPLAAGDEADLVNLRLAECDFHQRRFAKARDALRPHLDRTSRVAEARFYFLSAVREIGARDEYERLARELVNTFGISSWAEDTLSNLASYWTTNDEDDRADETFRDLLARFPKGRYAERATWKVGWRAYTQGRYDETVRQFEAGVAAFPQSDYRPAFLYWTARAHERLSSRIAADAAYKLVVGGYENSYYGRLSLGRLNDRRLPPATTVPSAITTAAANARIPPTADLIKVLLSLELYDQALDELLHAQRAWGDSPIVDATLGWVYNRKGDLRKGINAMRRAYPSYMASGGDRLPAEVLRVIYPLADWALIRREATARSLDPYLMAALIAQESTFDPTARSSANAIGMMQILASTGRHYARVLRLRRYSTAMLTRPEVNVQIGMACFANLMKRFGRADFALASYNAGETRVAQWIAERPGLEQDEFIDDVPFAETQNYLKRILGSAEDYRRLYPEPAKPAPKPVKTVPPLSALLQKPPRSVTPAT